VPTVCKLQIWNIPFFILTLPPNGGQPLTQGLSGNFFKGGDEILNPLDANFKGVDNKNLGCWNLPSMRGVDKKKWNIPL